MARGDDLTFAQRAANKAKLKQRALVGFYRFAKQYISLNASQDNTHISLGNVSKVFNILKNTPILKSANYNQLSLDIADMYPSDIEYFCDLDCSYSDDEVEDDENVNQIYDNTEKCLIKANPITNAAAFEVTTSDITEEDGDDDDNVTFKDSRNEYHIDFLKQAAPIKIRPKKKKRNTSIARTKEYMAKYDDMGTWVDLFL
jgi:hypothetical protein